VLRPTHWGAPPDSLDVIRGTAGREGEEEVWEWGEGGREEKGRT